MTRAPVIVAMGLCMLAAASDALAIPPLPGQWRGTLAVGPGEEGELPFGLELEREGLQNYRAFVINGPERIEIDSVRVDGEEVVLRFETYDSEIRARAGADGRTLTGTWRKTRGHDKVAEVLFEAKHGDAARFRKAEFARSRDPLQLGTPRWRVRLEGSEEDAVMILADHPSSSMVSGTILTPSGDYRYLAGSFNDGLLRLSCFDGAHAFLLRARATESQPSTVPDGGRYATKLEGEFRSGNWWTETWKAWLDPYASLPDAFGLTRADEKIDLDELSFEDLDGKRRKLSDSAFDGKARILFLFGSWCPNCHDATALMNELHEEYGDAGLAILGLAFEVTGDPERDRNQVRTYTERLRVEYPVLIAGIADKERASDAVPFLDRVRAYPTTVFMDGKGNVRAVHTGFSGPATGEEHQRLKQAFENNVRALLGLEASDGSDR